MQLDSQARADMLATISSAACSLTELDLALHSADLVNLQGKVAAVMATEIVLLREIAAKIFDIDLPHDPVQITEALARVPVDA